MTGTDEFEDVDNEEGWGPQPDSPGEEPTAPPTASDAALLYRQAGWWPLPLPPGAKWPSA